MGMGVRKEVWTWGPQRCHGYGRQSLVKGIRFEVYPRKKGIHVFQTPSIIQKHGDERNPKEELLLANL